MACPPAGGMAGALACLFWIAFVFSAFQIATAVYAVLPTQTLRTMHVAFLVLVGGGLIANHKAPNAAWRAAGMGHGARRISPSASTTGSSTSIS